MIFKSKYVAAHIWLTEFSRNTTLCNKIFQTGLLLLLKSHITLLLVKLKIKCQEVKTKFS